MTVVLLPEVEGLVRTFLEGRTEMVALVGSRVYTALPKDVVFPAVRVTQFDDIKITQRPLWVVRSSMQVEAWGGTKAQAFTAAATAQACLADGLEGVHVRGVVTGVTFGAMRDLPDVAYSPAKPRWLFTAYVTSHPV